MEELVEACPKIRPSWPRLKTPAASRQEQLDSLTGLRGFAALWVVSLHFEETTNQLLPASSHLHWFIGAGSNAVPLFFILSGFILLHTYRDRFEIFSWREYFRFLGLRLARIYPAYLAALIVMVMMVVASSMIGVPHSHDAYPLNWLLPEALMLQSWVRMPPDFFGWNYPDWSVSAEWFAYLFIFPPAVWLVKKISGVKLRLGLALIFAFGLCVLEPAVRTEWKLPTVSLLFLAGAFLWEWRRRQIQEHGKISLHLDTLGFALLFVALGCAARISKFETDTTILLAVLVLILGLSRADGICSRLLATRVCVFLGEISYSIYLVHGIVQRLLKIILPADKFTASPLPVRAGIVCVDFAAVLLAAMLLYFLIEHPARGWLRKKFSSRRTEK
ncbi:MAG TPA: acyltransferase [Verrucomicrobiae bacterium]